MPSLRPIPFDALRSSRRVELHAWRHARRYGVSRRMIDEATERRVAGDVAGACAAAGVLVTFDLAGVAARYGGTVAEQVDDDLRQLAPDLLRWYAPRRGVRGALRPKATGALSRYGGSGGPALLMRLPDTAEEAQRIRLSVEPVPDDRYHPTFDLPRAYWDARHTDGLRARCGGTGRIPFFHLDGTTLDIEELPEGPGSGDPVAEVEWLTLLWDHGRVIEALQLCGITVDGAAAEIEPDLPPVAVERLADEVRAELGPGRPGEVEVRGTYPGRPATVRIGRSGVAVLRRIPRSAKAGPRVLSEYRWRHPIDFDLLRFGLLAPDELHPLVHKALFPEREQRADGGPPPPAAPRPVQVLCGRTRHTLRVEGGRLRMPHTAEEVRRELVMLGLGATLTGCFQVVHAWTTGRVWLRNELAVMRNDLFERAFHGDTQGVLDLLDAGFDPAVRAEGGRSLLHYLPHLDHEALLPRLLAAGLDLDMPDQKGLTPLMAADGMPELVDSLIAAGATPAGWEADAG